MVLQNLNIACWGGLFLASIFAMAVILKMIILHVRELPALRKALVTDLKVSTWAGRTAMELESVMAGHGRDLIWPDICRDVVGVAQKKVLGGMSRLIFLTVPLATELGLLGTCIGMMMAMDSLSLSEIMNPKVALPGLATAMATTIAGLLISILLTAVYWFSISRANEKIEQMVCERIRQHCPKTRVEVFSRVIGRLGDALIAKLTEIDVTITQLVKMIAGQQVSTEQVKTVETVETIEIVEIKPAERHTPVERRLSEEDHEEDVEVYQCSTAIQI